MRLRVWLKKTGTSIRQLALLADVSYPTAFAYAHDRQRAQEPTAQKVSKATGGAVSVLELMTLPRSRGSAADSGKRKRRPRAIERAAA